MMLAVPEVAPGMIKLNEDAFSSREGANSVQGVIPQRHLP